MYNMLSMLTEKRNKHIYSLNFKRIMIKIFVIKLLIVVDKGDKNKYF